MAKRTIIVKFGEDEIVFENNGRVVTVKESTLLKHSSHAKLVHSIVAQHIHQGIDVTSEEYLKGFEIGIIWHCFHEGR